MFSVSLSISLSLSLTLSHKTFVWAHTHYTCCQISVTQVTRKQRRKEDTPDKAADALTSSLQENLSLNDTEKTLPSSPPLKAPSSEKQIDLLSSISVPHEKSQSPRSEKSLSKSSMSEMASGSPRTLENKDRKKESEGAKGGETKKRKSRIAANFNVQK